MMWWYPVFHILGFDYGMAYGHFIWYNFWSGFGGSVLFSSLILIPAWYWHHTCHYKRWCLRWGRHPAAGGTFMLCHKHHPDLDGKYPSHDLLTRLHGIHGP